MFPPDQTAELSTPAGRKAPRADLASAAESMPDGRSQHRTPAKIGVWEVGAVINDRYTLERRLGSGSMGEVFLASDRLLKKPVALKVLLGDMAKSRGTVRRFLREVALAHSVTHPNVVRIYDTGESDGLPYFSMEYLQGQTLDELIDASSSEEERQGGELTDPPMTLREIREISYEILSGLAAAHEAGIVHRDLKPANVMLTHRGAIVMDFGVAGFDSPTPGVVPNPGEARSIVRTEAGTIFGSPAYMAPELWEGAPATIQTDLYSFGVMLYQMLTGRLPIEAANAKAFLIKLREEKPIPVRTLRKDTPWNLALLVSRCMSANPEERPASADAAGNLVAPLAGRWRWLAVAVAVLLILAVTGYVVRHADERRFQRLGLPDAVAEKDLDAFVRSFDVGDYEAADRQLERLAAHAPDSAAVVFWRATLAHELDNEPKRLILCTNAGYEPEGRGEQWAGNTAWRELAMASCSISYSMSTDLWALLNPSKSSKLEEGWLPLAVTESLVPRVETARALGPSLQKEALAALERLARAAPLDEGPALALRWELARFDLLVALGRFDDARDRLEFLLELHTQAPLLSVRAANFFALRGELERAESLAHAVADDDPRPHLRLLLDAGRLSEGLTVIDGYVLQPGRHPLQQQMLDNWCGYAYRFEVEDYPDRCGAASPGLGHNMWIAARENIADLRAMDPLERQIIKQQAAFNRGEYTVRELNPSIITQAPPPFETYLRQLDIYTVLNATRKDADKRARALARELTTIAPGDPWALLVGATVDDMSGAFESAFDKRSKALARWTEADPDLPLVIAVRKLVTPDPELQLQAPAPPSAPSAVDPDPDPDASGSTPDADTGPGAELSTDVDGSIEGASPESP